MAKIDTLHLGRELQLLLDLVCTKLVCQCLLDMI